jgi:hypothetical protein
MVRSEVGELMKMGVFSSSQGVDLALIKRQQELLQRITPPVSDAEAWELVKLFGPDDYYGLAWTVLHLIEGAPHWPLRDCLSGSNEWINRLRERLERKDMNCQK